VLCTGQTTTAGGGGGATHHSVAGLQPALDVPKERQDQEPEPEQIITDPDLSSPESCGSDGSGSGTLIFTFLNFNQIHWAKQDY
jgi:hypothetical protein